MNALIVYDSKYGNTAEIAHTISLKLKHLGNVKVDTADLFDEADLRHTDLLIVGSPTQGGVTSSYIHDFLEELTPGSLKGIKVASFDTRLPARFAKIFGFAANRIARLLQEKGGKLVMPPEGFFVKGKKGPLVQGERARARRWAEDLFLASNPAWRGRRHHENTA